MQLFCLQASVEMLDEFIKENYISIDLPWLLEDAEFLSYEKLCSAYAEAGSCELLRLFVYEMKDEDLIIVTDGTRSYLGDVGDYYFVAEEHPSEAQQLPPRLHRRGVTWLRSFDKGNVHEKLSKFIAASETLVRFAQSVTIEDVESMMMVMPLIDHPIASAQTASNSNAVDAATVREAVHILKQALRCDDAERRERAAIALLQFAKQS